VGLGARHRGCLRVVFIAVALPIFDCGDRSTDCADCLRRENCDLFLPVAVAASNVKGARRHDDLDAPVVNAAHTGIERHPVSTSFREAP